MILIVLGVWRKWVIKVAKLSNVLSTFEAKYVGWEPVAGARKMKMKRGFVGQSESFARDMHEWRYLWL
jgi:hypothetical protein